MRNTAAKRYAEALHSIAREKDLSQEILQQLEAMAEIWRDQPGFRVLMTSPRVEMARKRETLAELAQHLHFRDAMTNLFNLILDKGRIDMVPDLAQEFRQLDDHISARARAHCVSARPLSETQLEQLRAKLIRAVGAKDVLITMEIDPRLLAGFTVSIEGKIIDGSLKGRLNRLLRSLTQEKQQER